MKLGEQGHGAEGEEGAKVRSKMVHPAYKERIGAIVREKEQQREQAKLVLREMLVELQVDPLASTMTTERRIKALKTILDG